MDHTLIDALTEREVEVLRLIAEGLSNREIAARLVVSLGTVKWHNNQIFSKLGVTSRTAALAKARLLGLIEDERPAPVGPAHPASVVHLPTLTTPLIGREALLNAINAALTTPEIRLITLIGQGGTGKTSLAIRSAELGAHHFPDGVFFASLASLTSPDYVPMAVAKLFSLDLDEGGEALSQLFDHLAGRRLLLILDNFEHLLDASGFVSELLNAAAGITVLVTSRERLNLQEEHLFHVDGLPLPEQATYAAAAESAAVQLFVERARALRHDFALTSDNWPAVLEICRLVEGLPLGIILAAAWIELLKPREIAAEIRRSVDFLHTDLRNLPQRHRSMRAVFDATWRLLNDAERRTFQRLAVFHGGFDREAAERIAAASLPTLLRLVNKSLIARHENGRFSIHELLRAYAQEQLHAASDGAFAYSAHAAYYLELLQHCAEDETRYAALESDFENIRAAWHYALAAGSADTIAEALDTLYAFCVHQGRYLDILYCADAAIAAAEQQPDIFSRHLLHRLYECRGNLYMYVPQFASAARDLEAARQYAHATGDDVWERNILLRLGQLFRRTEQFENAIHHLQMVLLHHRQTGNYRAAADALYHLGTVMWDLGRNREARASHQEAVDICEELRLRDIVTLQALHGLGEALMFSGDAREARRVFLVATDLARELGDVSYEAENLQMAAWNSIGTLGTGNAEEGFAFFEQSLDLSRKSRLEWLKMCSIIGLGLHQANTGVVERAHDTLNEGIDLAMRLASSRMLAVALDSRGQLYQDLGLYALAQRDHERGIRLLREMGSDYWMQRLRANLAIDMMRQGVLDHEAVLLDALHSARENDSMMHGVRCLEALAEMYLHQNQPQKALMRADELLAHTDRYALTELQAQAHRWRAEALLALGRMVEAEQALRAALPPGRASQRLRLQIELYRLLAAYYRRAGQHEEEHEAAALADGLMDRLLTGARAAGLIIDQPR